MKELKGATYDAYESDLHQPLTYLASAVESQLRVPVLALRYRAPAAKDASTSYYHGC